MSVASVRRIAGRAYRYLRRTPDRLLHASRRQAAREMLADRRPIRRVLFICLGNICRSPYAEYSFAKMAARHAGLAGIEVRSAGFIGPGRPSPGNAVSVSRRRGVDLTPHRSQVADAEMVRGADLVVVMESAQLERIVASFGGREKILVLGDLDPQAIRSRTILDPYNKSERAFGDVYERIDRCLRELCRELAR